MRLSFNYYWWMESYKAYEKLDDRVVIILRTRPRSNFE